MSKLTGRTNVPFELCFKYPLERGYTFKELKPTALKQFQGFLNKVARMTAHQVDKNFLRNTDTNDEYKGLQVYHYAVSDKFRIHVVLEEGSYKVIRLDPNHKFHP